LTFGSEEERFHTVVAKSKEVPSWSLWVPVRKQRCCDNHCG
jgi:hypothetical protein